MSSRSLIRKVKEEDGYVYIQVPYQTKDLFKKAFRGAKWHPGTKTWVVKKRKDLEERIERFNAKLEETGLAEVYDRELDIDEMEKMIEEMARKKEKVLDELNRRYREVEERYRRLRREMERREESEKLRELIEEKEAEILKIYGAAAEARDEADRNEAEIRSRLERIIDEEAVERFDRAFGVLEKEYSRKGFNYAETKNKVKEARRPLKNIAEDLLVIGVRSRGIDCRLDLNVNRPDRDHPGRCPDLYEIESVGE